MMWAVAMKWSMASENGGAYGRSELTIS